MQLVVVVMVSYREPVWSQTQFYNFCFKGEGEGMSPVKTVTKH